MGATEMEPGRPARIAIVGGGAGGLELAIRVSRLTGPGRRAEVTLVDRSPAHVWKPRLHEIATGLLVAADEEARYSVQAKRHGFAFELGEVCGVDPAARRLEIAATAAPAADRVARGARAEILPARTLDYDVAVLAVGSTVNDFGTPGVVEHCYTLDDPAVAERFHAALLAKAMRVRAGLQPKVVVAIVGAGSTGVELAGELRASANRLARLRSLMPPSALEVILLEMADRPLPSAAPSLSRYAHGVLERGGVQMRFGARVVRVDADRLHLGGGEEIVADLVVWASGVRAGRLARTVPGLLRDRDGRVHVDASLRIMGEDGLAVEGLYGLGDCAAFTPVGAERPVGATAQAAHQQAAVLARTLARQLRGRAALPFRFHDRGTLVSLGAEQAAGGVPTRGGHLQFHGPLALLAYAALYDQHLIALHGVARTAALRASDWLRRSAQPTVKMDW